MGGVHPLALDGAREGRPVRAACRIGGAAEDRSLSPDP